MLAQAAEDTRSRGTDILVYTDMRTVWIAASLLLCALPLTAQEKPAADAKPATDTKSEADTKPAVANDTVAVTVVALDKKNEIIPALKVTDFTLQADKKPQTIATFEPLGALPMTVGVLFDTSHSSESTLQDEQDATAAFLNKNLSKGNKAFLVEFASQVQLVADVTDQGPALQAGLKTLKTTPPLPLVAASVPDNSGNGNDNVIRTGQTLYDAIFLSTDEVTKKYPTRRVLIVFSDGIDRKSKESLEVALEAAQRSNTVIYGIYIEPDMRRDTQPQQRRTAGNGGPGGTGNGNGSNGNCSGRSGGYPGGGGGIPGIGLPGGGGYPQSPGTSNCTPSSQKPTGADHKPLVDGHATLDRIAGETGGRVFDVTRHDPMDKVFDEIVADLHAQYRLTFTPKDLDTTRDHYHQIDLVPVGALEKQKPLLLWRDGFYTGDSVRY